MSKEICISSTPHETRLAIVEDDQLTEIYYERENEYTLAGSIYKGRVTRVLPGMQSAFVDVGLERDAFLYVTDFLEEQEDSEDFEHVKSNGSGQVQGGRGEGGEEDRAPAERGRSDRPRSERRQRPASAEAQLPVEAHPAITIDEVSVGSDAGAAQPQEEFEEGTRRWRGRRGRRRGVKSPRESGAQGTSIPGSAAPAREYESSEPEEASSVASETTPYAMPAESARRQASPSSSSAAPAVFLPGETLSKYGHAAQEGRGTEETAKPQVRTAPITSKPSTLVDQPIAWDGVSSSMPGESLSRYRNRSEPATEHASAAGEKDLPQTSIADGTASAAPVPEGALRVSYGDTATYGNEFAPSAAAEDGTEAPHTAHQTPSAVVPFRVGTHDTNYDTNAPAAVASEPETIDQAFPPAQLESEANSASQEESHPAVHEHHIEHGLPPANETLASDQHETSAIAPVPLVLEEAEVVAPSQHLEAVQPQQAEQNHGIEEQQQVEQQHDFEEEELEFEPENASASHRIDPASPSEFRLTPTLESDQEAQPHSEIAQESATDSRLVAVGPHHELDELAAYPGLPPERPSNSETESAGATPSEQSVAPGADSKAWLNRPAIEATETDRPELERSESDPSQQPIDNLHAFTPGDGHLEEEVIDEEEYDFSPIDRTSGGSDDEHDYGDLEEETLDHGAGGPDVGELIREAQIDRQVQGAGPVEEGEFEESDGAEDTDGDFEEEPAEAISTEQAPAQNRRDSRGSDRQRGGRSRHGRGNGRNQGGGGRRQSAQMSDLPIISELLKQGQEILVQIAKEPIAKKGARITSHIALPGRFLVFMPTVNHVGVSRKISSDEERLRLKRILTSEKGQNSGGFIVRTAADGASEEELRADLRFLISLWNEIKQRSDAGKAPALIYHDLNLVERILRDQVSDNFSTIWVDSESEYERIVRFLNRFQPSLVRRVKLYTKETPLFEQFGIQDEISKALKSKVWLKSGGSIVINQTEALVAIDINTGKYVGKTARLEDTILKTNLDAIPEIVRQIRLRDLGGIIVIDFIDMDERKNRHKVMQALEEALKADRAPSKVLQFNDFGLVAITRKRVKQSLERTLSVQCDVCAGTGMVKSPTTVCNEIYTEMRKMQKHFERHDVMLRVHPEVVKTLKANSGRWLNELEEMTARTVIVKSDPALHPEQFDIH